MEPACGGVPVGAVSSVVCVLETRPENEGRIVTVCFEQRAKCLAQIPATIDRDAEGDRFGSRRHLQQCSQADNGHQASLETMHV